MADFNKYLPTMLKWEGGWSNHPMDKGGPTKYGVILKQWIDKGWDKDGDGDVDVEDLKIITQADAGKIAKTYYWDKVKGDLIKDQSLAEFLADFAYNSGVPTASKKIQQVLGFKGEDVDGILGPVTLAKINSADPKATFEALKASRAKYVNDIVKNNPSQKVFLKGWLNRINSFTYKP